MRITCLLENTAARPEIVPEHGLSLHIRLGDRRILFDMGQTEAFAENAARLGVELAAVDTAILSHGHYDHGGGMERFLRENTWAKVYHSDRAFGSHWHGEKYIGLDQGLRGHPRLQPVADEMSLGDGLTLYACHGKACRHPIRSAGLTVRCGEAEKPEQFDHEQYLLIEAPGRRVLISGCSHRGIANIVDWFHPDVLVGGFHLMKMDPTRQEDSTRLEQLARELLQSGTVFYTGHCTGEAAYAFMKERMGEKLHYLRAGKTIEV